MRHKIEGSLATLECGATTSECGCESNKERKVMKCLECDLEKANDDIQKLIECQLSVKELEYLIMRMNFTRNIAMFTEVDEKCKLIVEKLDKQKGMWVNDEC